MTQLWTTEEVSVIRYVERHTTIDSWAFSVFFFESLYVTLAYFFSNETQAQNGWVIELASVRALFTWKILKPK